jgi:predicted SAM-dependent methyltransferase
MAQLNVGSGPHYADGWVNIDVVEPLTGRPPDLYIDALEAGDRFEREMFDRAYMGHVLEHIDWENVPAAVRSVASTVKTGGVVMIVGPCILRACATGQPADVIQGIVADPRHVGDPRGHAWTPTEELTLQAAVAGGLSNVRAVPIGTVGAPEWPNPSQALWQTAVTGVVG